MITVFVVQPAPARVVQAHLLSRTPFNEKVGKENIAMRYRYMLFACILVLTADVVLAIEETRQVFVYDDYAAVLKDHVDDKGMVDYKKFKAAPQRLDAFITAMSKVNPKNYDRWNKEEKIALWLNAYNALTLKALIDNYPIKSSFFRSRIYPKNSIRQIPGVWSKIKFNVMGRDLTLGHIEHEILRKKFTEPRIHMAMVCAAMGCPPLLNKPYTAQKLNEQLDERTRRFLANPAKFKIDRSAGVVYLSTIFKWFKGDFVTRYAPDKNISKQGKEVSSVLNFIAGHLEKSDREYILKGDFKIKYLKYDWSLNEQQIKDKKSKESKE
ncbi:MAG: DUF547 domain-containing protein [Planctomycetes bacterium]|nr:DUF547 domain-containing protein [Planctomycetota bacterium]